MLLTQHNKTLKKNFAASPQLSQRAQKFIFASIKCLFDVDHMKDIVSQFQQFLNTLRATNTLS